MKGEVEKTNVDCGKGIFVFLSTKQLVVKEHWAVLCPCIASHISKVQYMFFA